jgi:hypothetical protein
MSIETLRDIQGKKAANLFIDRGLIFIGLGEEPANLLADMSDIGTARPEFEQ